MQLEPQRLIRFGGPRIRRGFFQYELAEGPVGTRLRFIQHFAPDGVFTETPDDLGGDLPGGPGTPWKPGFVGGWREFWDALGGRMTETQGQAHRTWPAPPEALERAEQGLSRAHQGDPAAGLREERT